MHRSPRVLRRVAPGLLGALLLLLVAAAPDEPVAWVGDVAIPASAFEQSYLAALLETGAPDTRQARYRHLDALLDTYRLAAEAERRELAPDALYLDEVTRARRRALAARYYHVALLDSLPPPTDAELREAYLRTLEHRTIRQARYATEAEARAARALLRADGDFEREALRAAGADTSAARPVTLPYFDLDDALAEEAWALAPGDVSEPVRSRGGWHLLRVEGLTREALPTENGYARARPRLRERVAARRRRLEGDLFVRRVMEAADVRVHADAVAALDALLAPDDALPTAVAAAGEAAPEVPDLRPETVLADYACGPRRCFFTAADYRFWLASLPASEARARVAASVGRAMRNEVFAQAGEALGLADDPIVRAEVEARERHARAALLLRALGAEGVSADAVLDRLRARDDVRVDTTRFEALMQG